MSAPRERFVLAIGIPLAAIVGAGALVWAVSRILLAADVAIAPVIAILFALNILTAAGVAATFPRRKGVVLALVAAVAIPIVAAGVVGAVVGERPVHNLVAEEEGGGHGGGEEGGGGGEGGGEESPEPEESPEEEESPDPEETGGGGGATAEIVAEGVVFTTDSFSLPPESEVTVAFDNRDTGVPHNVAIYTDESASEEIFVGEIFPGPEVMEYAFTSPAPGDYFFRCDVHPTTMTGTVTVG